MSNFLVNPHGRLQEWIADEKGYPAYVHYYLNELPERHAKLIDVKRFGPGERLVFEPFSETMYNNTQQWIRERGIFEDATPAPGAYTTAVINAST